MKGLQERAADWVNDKTIKADGNVFIHCHAGISRSSTVTISFMIKYLGYKSDTALLHIRKGRNIANPNSSFWKELEQMDRKYEKIYFHSIIVSVVSGTGPKYFL